MTQPPDERPPSGEQPTPPEEPASEAAPTVAGTPPGEVPTPPGDPAQPTPPPSTGWELPTSPPPLAPPPATEGWQMPGATTQRAMLHEGYVVGSTGARFVAWLIDTLLVSIVPGALTLYVYDWPELFRQIFDQMRFDANGHIIPNYGASYTIPVTLDLVLVSLIVVGLQFIYFVGFWTSRWQATPGMIGLKLRVVDAQTGTTLTLPQAGKRWVALGSPLGLLVLVPVLQSAASLAEFALTLFLFLSTVTNDRRQGLHDRFAGSQVIRHVSSGAGATAIGCIVYGIMLFAVWIAVVAFLIAVAGPSFFEFARELPRYTP
jgi:uncharacterized RDD family membrane protein YckC